MHTTRGAAPGERRRVRQRRGLAAALTAGVLLGQDLLAQAVGGQASTTRTETAAAATATFPDRTVITLEVAGTEAERQRGLMHRASLPERAGMIFLFDRPGIYPFWMKNTLIPLDMLWTDTKGRIAWIAEAVPPCKADPCPEYPPQAVASYVIEVNAGFAKRHGLKVGDVVTLRNVTR